MINIELIILILLIGINLSLGALVLIKGARNLSRIFFLSIVFSFCFWALATFFEEEGLNPEIVQILVRFDFALALIITYSFFQFCRYFERPKEQKSSPVFESIQLFAAICLIVLSLAGFVIQDILFVEEGIDLQPSPVIYYIYTFLLFYFVVGGIGILYKKFRHSDGINKQRIRYVLLGLSLSSLVALMTNLVIPIFIDHPTRISRAGIYGIIFFISFSAYAITKYRLMDIRFVIKRSILYTLLVGFFTAVFFLAGKIVSGPLEDAHPATQDAVFVITGLLLVFIFQPVNRLLDRVTDRIFFRDQIDYQEVLRRMSAVISFEIDFDSLTKFLVEELSLELKLKNARIFTLNKMRRGMVLSNSSEGKYRVPLIPMNTSLLERLSNNRNVIIREELHREIEDTRVQQEKKKAERIINDMEKIDATLVLPIIVEGQLTAMMVLGEKRSGDLFSHQDLNLLELLSPQIGTALQRATLYKEVKEFNKKLRKEVEDATHELQVINVQLQERNNFLLALQKITNIVTRTLDYKKVVKGIVDGIAEELRFVGGALILIDEKTQEVYVEAVSETVLTKEGMDLLAQHNIVLRAPMNAENDLVVQAIRENRVISNEDLGNFSSRVDPGIMREIQKRTGIRSAVIVPIRSEEKTIGALAYFLSISPDQLSDPYMQVMYSLADQTGIVTQNLRLYAEIQRVNSQLRDLNKHLKELDLAKSEFMSIASHQLRTPLSGIMGYVSMMVEGDYGKFTNEQYKVLQDVLEASRRMIRLVNVFLNVTRIEAGRLKLERREISMNDVVEHVLTELRPQALAKKLELTVEKLPSLTPLWLDPDKINDVVLNLVDNAIKYTQEGSIHVRIEEEKEVVRVTVQDTGVGIEKNEAKKLFEKFVRGSGIARVQPDGSGLGLFIAKKIVEAHKGRIWVESDGADKGSRFIFELPIKENNAETVEQEKALERV